MARRYRRTGFLLFLVAAAFSGLAIAGCAGVAGTSKHSCRNHEVRQLSNTLSLRQKIGQRFIGWLPPSGFSGEVRELTQAGEIGGFIIYKWNFETLEGLQELTGNMQREALEGEAGIPLFLAADQEGGRVAAFRFSEFVQLPAPFHLANILPPDAVEAAAYVNAVQLRSIGINMNLAPVLDLYPVADNTIIGDRSFGSDQRIVAQAGVAFVQGTLRGGVLPVIKHFPGHGISTVDSHGELPVVSSFADRELERHLSPFSAAIQAEAPAIMPAHIMYPDIDPVYPVTLSDFFIKKLLREELGFSGLIVSDGLSMGALARNYSLEDTLVRCFRVGIDIILVHTRYSVRELVDTVITLVEEGKIREEWIEEGVFRVLDAKRTTGLFQQKSDQ